jgi:hypothetical protein
MKKYFVFIILLSFISTLSFAQDAANDSTGVNEKDKPVRSPFESGYLIDAQTTVIPNAKTLEAVIQHKFGPVENGRSDLFGIYAAGANIRLGLNYVLLKNFQVGAGITKMNMATDVNAKWTIIQQTRKGTNPLSFALYGNMAIDGRNISAFGSESVRATYGGLPIHYKATDRLSYFSELIIGRKFCDMFSLQTAVSFTHFNATTVITDSNNKEIGVNEHDKVAVHLNGRIKVSPQGSIIFNYDQPLKIKDISEQHAWTNTSLPNLAFGYEVSTSTHAFQIYMGTTKSLLPQETIMNNHSDLNSIRNYCIGFNITRLWGF